MSKQSRFVERTREEYSSWVSLHGVPVGQLEDLMRYPPVAAELDPDADGRLDPDEWPVIVQDGVIRLVFHDAPMDATDDERRRWFAELPGRKAVARELFRAAEGRYIARRVGEHAAARRARESAELDKQVEAIRAQEQAEIRKANRPKGGKP